MNYSDQSTSTKAIIKKRKKLSPKICFMVSHLLSGTLTYLAAGAYQFNNERQFSLWIKIIDKLVQMIDTRSGKCRATIKSNIFMRKIDRNILLTVGWHVCFSDKTKSNSSHCLVYKKRFRVKIPNPFSQIFFFSNRIFPEFCFPISFSPTNHSSEYFYLRVHFARMNDEGSPICEVI